MTKTDSRSELRPIQPGEELTDNTAVKWNRRGLIMFD